MRKPFTLKSKVFLTGATAPFVVLVAQSKTSAPNFAFERVGEYTHFTPLGLAFAAACIIFAVCLFVDRRFG